jgi:hypothetical protein
MSPEGFTIPKNGIYTGLDVGKPWIGYYSYCISFELLTDESSSK